MNCVLYYFCCMLSEKEEQFIIYWERSREMQSTFLSKVSSGLPMALVFGLPILLSVVIVYLFFPEWYTKISNTGPGTFKIIVIAVFVAMLFFSYFRMQFKWEMNEQAYQELKNKQLRSNAANKEKNYS